MTAPTPPDAIPDFLLEQLSDLSPETLCGLSEYAREETYVAPDGAPDTIIESFALQDDETIAATATYADSLADFLEDNDADSLAAIAGAQGEDEEKWGHQNILQWHGG